MSNLVKTEQESFWEGEFGNLYVTRNQNSQYLVSNLALFSQILSKTKAIASVIEFGANIGFNLMALKQLLPTAHFSAIEINQKAVEQLSQLDWVQIYHQSILDFQPTEQKDFVLSKGVLIHIGPAVLDKVYALLYSSSKRYICLVEYYNPSPVEVTYRGHENKLFKRDFAGEMLDRFPDLELVDYGFVYHRDRHFPLDDMNWFLLEKSGG